MTRNVFWVNINMENMLMCKIFYKHLVGLSVSLCIGWSASPATHLLPKVSWGTRLCIWSASPITSDWYVFDL